VNPLATFIADEMAEAVDPRVAEVATAIAAEFGTAAEGVIFYGSCLRESQLDGLMLDFYVIVSDYRSAYQKRWLATANRLIPPNVFPFVHEGLSAKYAVLSRDDLSALVRPEASTVSVWARFAQPVRLVWSASEAARTAIVADVAQAPVTMVVLAKPMGSDGGLDSIWRTGFALTYACELRAERSNRSGSIVDANPARYKNLSAVLPVIPNIMSRQEAERRWSQLRRHGKVMSIVRLAKASLTFAGGIDYLAWKINRHAGTEISVTPWQRRWPLLGAIVLLPKLFRQGAIK
jgi:nitroreductase